MQSPDSLFRLLSDVHHALAEAAAGARAERRTHLFGLMQGISALASEHSGRRLVLAPLGDAWWLLGAELAPQRLRFRGLALEAAHASFSGEAPLCSEFTPAASADAVVREALRNAAENIEGMHGCWGLASALRQLTVGGKPPRIEYRRRVGGPILVLSSRDVTSAPAAITIRKT